MPPTLNHLFLVTSAEDCLFVCLLAGKKVSDEIFGGVRSVIGKNCLDVGGDVHRVTLGFGQGYSCFGGGLRSLSASC